MHKNAEKFKIVIFVSGLILIFNIAYGQQLNLEEIYSTLMENPPNNGDFIKRKQAIISLDNILKNDSCRISNSFKTFYSDMMNKVNSEMADFDGTPTIWTMYNHGYIIMTEELTFAFDLVHGYWDYSLFPSEIISRIDILFISHSHSDHYSYGIANQIKEQGGTIVVPSAISNYGTVSMEFGDTLELSGLKIKIHEGLHSVPNAIFEVTTPDGIKFLHTGDNQTSSRLPDVDGVDVLLLNAWVNESGFTSAVVGMENSMNKIKPSLIIPGHLQELGHEYNPSNMTTRVPYEWVYDVTDIPINSEILVMAWGEKFELPESMANNIDKSEIIKLPQICTLSQNYPNPFNPSTKIEFTIPKSEFVELKVYNILGNEVSTLVSKKLNQGNHTYTFNGKNLASGIYYYQLVTGDFREVKKMILLR